MFDKMINALQTPKLYKRSNQPFWDDEHISKGMLEAHLNPDWDAASRKHSFIDSSVDWLSTVIPKGGKVLDIGCGPGLYTRRLSDKGYDVTGMDYSKRSIAYAKEQDTKTKYIYQNYLELDYRETFDVIILIYCDYAALTDDERQVLLPRVYSALKPGGLFIFDVNTVNYMERNKAERTSWNVFNNGGYWSKEPHICLEATYLYEDNTVSVDRYLVVTEKEVKEYLIWETIFTIPKLTDEVSPYGFKVKDVYNDVAGTPFTQDGEVICFVIER